MTLTSRLAESRDLEFLAHPSFGSFSEAETRLLKAACKGELAVCGISTDDDDPSNNPFTPAAWGAERRIRPALIRWLCTDRSARDMVDPRGLRMSGAWIEERLDLSCLAVPFGIGMGNCVLNGGIDVSFGTFIALVLERIALPHLNAEAVTTKNSLCFRRSWCTGLVNLVGAHIGGDAAFDGSFVSNPSVAENPDSGVALNAQQIRVEGSVLLRDGFTAEGLVWMTGAQIRGSLECGNARFQNAPVEGLLQTGRALVVDGAKVGTAVLLRRGFAAKGEVRLYGTSIGADLDCAGGHFSNPKLPVSQLGGVAINATGVVITGSINLGDSFLADGQVHLDEAEIKGSINCAGGTFLNPVNVSVLGTGLAVNAENIKVGGSVQLRDGFRAEGIVWLAGASIAGALACDGATFCNPAVSGVESSGLSLAAMHAKIGGGLFLTDGFFAEGCVSLVHAEVGRTLVCDRGQFVNPSSPSLEKNGIAIDLEGARIGGDVFLREGFKAYGQVYLNRAEIRGGVECDGGQFHNPVQQETKSSGVALSLDDALVSGNVFLRRRFRAEGQVRMSNCQIRGNLDCDNGQFHNSPRLHVEGTGLALIAENLEIAGNILMRTGFVAEGTVHFYGAKIGRSIECDAGRFLNAKNDACPNSGMALNLRHAKIAGSVFLRNKFHSEGIVNLWATQVGGDLDLLGGRFETLGLINASVDTVLDDEESGPHKGNLFLEGFTYRRISVGSSSTAKGLIAWIKRQDTFTRQPYRQLSRFLRESGDEIGSRIVSSRMQDNIWRARGWKLLPLRLLLKGTIGFGYYSMRALWWLSAFILLGSLFYMHAYSGGSIVPSNKEVYEQFKKTRGTPDYYIPFNAFFYSLETSLPVIRLGVEDKWSPAPEDQTTGTSVPSNGMKLTSWTSAPAFIRWFRFVQICTGWVLATLFLGGISGLVRRE